jgi:hypothetical protein
MTVWGSKEDHRFLSKCQIGHNQFQHGNCCRDITQKYIGIIFKSNGISIRKVMMMTVSDDSILATRNPIFNGFPVSSNHLSSISLSEPQAQKYHTNGKIYTPFANLRKNGLFGYK